MANNLSQKPWRIDTVATTGVQVAGRVKVRNILDNINSWWFNGFRVQTLGSGVVFIDYE